VAGRPNAAGSKQIATGMKQSKSQFQVIKGPFTRTVIFSFGCDFQCWMQQKIGSILFFVWCRMQLPHQTLKITVRVNTLLISVAIIQTKKALVNPHPPPFGKNSKCLCVFHGTKVKQQHQKPINYNLKIYKLQITS
jgi:hypothetical protein